MSSEFSFPHFEQGCGSFLRWRKSNCNCGDMSAEKFLMETKMSVGLLFVIVFLKIVGAVVECEHPGNDCVIPAEETFKLLDNRFNSCSDNPQWSLNTPYKKILINGSDGFLMGCSNNKNWLQKEKATLSDSGEYEFMPISSVFHEVLVFNATLKTQRSEDGKHLGVLLQLEPPSPPLKKPPTWNIEAFDCPSAKINTPRYMSDNRWRLLDVERDDGLKLCCHFNVTKDDSYSRQYSIRPNAAPKTAPCSAEMRSAPTVASISERSSAPTSLTSTSEGTYGPGSPAAQNSSGLTAVSASVKLLSTAVATIIANSVFHFV